MTRLACGVRCCMLATVLAGMLAPPDARACEWQLFPTVDPFPTGNQLNVVAGTAPNDVWETGNAYAATASHGYVLHWNGRRWSTFAESDPSGFGGSLSGFAAIAPNDAWTVGEYYTAAKYGAPQAIAEHWNGKAFSVTPLPGVAGASTFLYGLAAVAPGDLWAVGGAIARGGLQSTYVVHRTRDAWSIVASPNVPGMATNLDAVAGTSPNDVWTVGGFRTGNAAPFRTLAEHWDGTAWRIVPTPNANPRSNVFNAVVALGPSDAWAIGDYYNGKAYTPLAEHWDGRAWTIVETPATGARTALMYGVAAVSHDDVYASGEVAKGGGRVVTLVLHWDGRRWSTVSTPNVRGALVTLLNGIAKIPGGGVWAVGGTANTKTVVHTVTEIHGCAEDSPLDRR